MSKEEIKEALDDLLSVIENCMREDVDDPEEILGILVAEGERYIEALQTAIEDLEK